MSAELKALQVRLNKAKSTAHSLKSEAANIQREYAKTMALVTQLEGEISKLTVREIQVSEHAMLRYYERAFGADPKEVREKILTPQLVNCIETLGNGKFPMGDGYRAVVKDRVVISIIPQEEA